MTKNTHLDYIKLHLVPEIVSQLKNESLDTFEVVDASGLDGFMSALYNISLKTKTDEGPKERLLISKFMKGDVAFRESSKSFIQFANEIFIYAKVLPEFAKVLKEVNITTISIADWVPQSYVAKFGYVENLSVSSSERECVLVLEHLKPHGYTLGPRLYLNRDHLFAMCKPIGQYHALSYALRICNEAVFTRLKKEIVPLPFINDNDPNDANSNLYRVLYRLAFDRFYDYFDRSIDGNTFDKTSSNDLKLIESLQRMREKYFAEPTRLHERIRTQVEDSEEDRRFSAILHGDFNRNNVLFRYKIPSVGGVVDEVEDVKMIDFQEMRYGTISIDLAFFMYMNTMESIRDDVWMEVLKVYHTHMFETLSNIIKAHNYDKKKVEKTLREYSFENFYAHFSRYAIYGVLICMHFLPWILCSEKECARLSHLFETDMHGEEFRTLSIEAGGDDVNIKILDIMRHACKKGYMNNI